jgi:deazaflavin-dependent oxidoreductase (nitroreductase family)
MKMNGKLNVKLITKGRRSGEPRRVTLYAFEDGDRLVVVGSMGGAAADPQWVGNLRAEPRATVRNGPDVREVQAQEVDGPDRERLWTLVSKAFPLYLTYQRKTERLIPLFVLETVEGA